MTTVPDVSGRDVLLAGVSEREFAQTVVDLAEARGWLAYRTWNSQHSPAGFPDLTLVRNDRLVMAELKTMKGRVSPAQRQWLDALKGAGVEVHLWRPDQMSEIEEVLR